MKRILITGLTGLIGARLAAQLRDRGDTVEGLSRGRSQPSRGVRHWDPTADQLDPDTVSGFDAVVHLAGENIGEGRWTAQKKARIKHSRVHATRILCEALARALSKPGVLVASSAVGYYGNRGVDILTEDRGPGPGFLAEVVVQWEEAAAPARDAGIAVINPRSGPALSTRGGALAKMLLPFRLGLGGVVGNGDQYMSWIALDDLVAALVHLIDLDVPMVGAVNVVAPKPVTNREFTRALGSVIRRPTLFPLPAAVARLVLGEVADELLLVSQRASAERLERSGYEFRFRELGAALEHVVATRT